MTAVFHPGRWIGRADAAGMRPVAILAHAGDSRDRALKLLEPEGGQCQPGERADLLMRQIRRADQVGAVLDELERMGRVEFWKPDGLCHLPTTVRSAEAVAEAAEFERHARRALTGMVERYGEDGLGHGFAVMHRWLRKRRARLAAVVVSTGEDRP